MIIKKFQAKTEPEAISLAKKEMGENVVIMSARSIKKKGLFSFLKKLIFPPFPIPSAVFLLRHTRMLPAFVVRLTVGIVSHLNRHLQYPFLPA